ncbi:hypothetical protein PIB30_105771 [Stylosanthes scabra]|uniref:Aminotransferase-like plant mobile domain-containing protein n=1 Tax=Stylosanthes scabra TaxID=79078 RepID=A0ABU6YWF4_9FABA|nr:hypothetical protein [Stylosanthes scabra]
MGQIAWPLARRLIGFQQPDRDRQEGRLLRWREELDRSDITQFRWTPYDVQELQAIVPDWIRSHLEIYTWRSAVPVVCFNMVHMHHVDRVLRQYGGEQPVPRSPVDLTRLMTSTGRDEDRWWPGTLRSWYDGWRGRGSPQVLVSIHACTDFRGTQEYFTWYVAAVGAGRFLSQARRLDDPRWMFAPPDLPSSTAHPRDDLAMPEEAPARRRRAAGVGRGRRPPKEREDGGQGRRGGGTGGGRGGG